MGGACVPLASATDSAQLDSSMTASASVVPAVYDTVIRHVRTTPVLNAFTYRSYQWLVDLDKLPRLPWPLRPLARFESRDHLGDPAGTLRSNLDGFLAGHGIDVTGGKILMLANARVLGHCVNPLTVFWCHHEDGSLACVVAEVQNTYRQTHAYVLRPDQLGRTRTVKRLYVSPFNPVDGEYALSLPEPDVELALTISLHRSVGRPLVATVRGRRRPATTRALLRSIVRVPWSTAAVTAQIRWQGTRLLLRGVPVEMRPPSHYSHPRRTAPSRYPRRS